MPLGTVFASEPTELKPLASVGPWTYATAPILYRDRIWFVNANRWPDHNSADVWSMRRDGRDLRRERRLFSQDVGRPVVHQDLLYWPHEDPRASLGWGEISVTDGENWRVLQTRTGRQFHLHGLYQQGGTLFASGSAWSAQILMSDDRGASWSQRYERARAEKRFSRTYQLVPSPSGLFGDVIEFGNGPRSFQMLLHNGDTPKVLPHWPATKGLLRRAVPWRGGALALFGLGGSQELRRMDGETFERIALPPDVTVIDMDVAGGIWLLARIAPKQHQIWYRQDDVWQLKHRFTGDEAVEMRLISGAPVVTGTDRGLGVVWGNASDVAPVLSAEGRRALPSQIVPVAFDRDEALGQIRSALDDPRSYVGHGVGLRRVLDKWVVRGLKGSELSPFLTADFPDGEPVRLIGGRAFASHERFGRWVLAWAMRRAGGGDVPPGWLSVPFDEAPNDSQKYFSEPLAAIWTMAVTGQDGQDIRAALADRQTRKTDPAWLRMDAEMALKVLTDK